MFSLATGIYQSYFAPPKLSILIIGLDGSGKTSLLERIKVTDIQTRIGVTPACNAPSLPASYAKGGAVAGVGNSIDINTNNGMANGLQQQQQQQKPLPQRGGQHQEGGKPARLPPPLPPKQALKSHKCVEKMMEDGFSKSATVATDEVNNGAVDAQRFLQSVPPPPLVADGNTDSSSSEEDRKQVLANKKTNKSNKPHLPPRHVSITKIPAITPITVKPLAVKKKGSFLELLRCPSPKKYSDAALGEDDDEEEYHDNNHTINKDALDPWSTEYLKDYYINYQAGEEFDIKKLRSGGGQPKKMFPLDRIRPTLGQNLAKLDLCGCKCSLFDLSGAVSTLFFFIHHCIFSLWGILH